MQTQLIGYGLLAFVATSSSMCSAQEADGSREINEAIVMLEAKIPFAANDLAKDKIQKGVESLRKLVSPVSEKEQPVELSLAQWKKKLNAKTVVYNAKTAELSLFYDFRRPQQIKDFENYDLSIARLGCLAMIGASQAQHVVRFQTCAIAAVFEAAHGDCTVLSTDNGFTARQYGHNRLLLFKDNREVAIGRFKKPTEKPKRFRAEMNQDRFACMIDDVNIATVTDTDGLPTRPFQVSFGPCVGPVAYYNLTLVGKVDQAWAADFLNAD